MHLNFIKDGEINLKQNDLLATKPYADTLLDIIETADTPFTIGLFGGWGTGKSSIIKTIEDKYDDDKSSKTRVFVYDAWKYSEDSFRRTFILKLKEKFGLEGDVDYQNFYNDEHEEIAHKNQIDGKMTFLGSLYLLPLVLFIVWFIPKATLDLQLALSVISFISTIIFYFLKDVYVQYKISISKPKTFAPEQFEDAFTDAIQKIAEPTKLDQFKNWFKVGEKTIFTERVVIVIDNIDRCHKDLAFKLLLTIKNFLEQKNVVFIIPIDEKEVKKHIIKEGHDGNEFLRKLFSTAITIRKFSENDLFEFTKALQKKYNLALTNDALSLIAQEFSKSPRKIIQFLNVLQTEIKLAEEQERSVDEMKASFEPGTITSNIEFLVKILLIREEWADLYDVIQDNPFILEDINSQIDSWNEKIIIKKDTNGSEEYALTSEQRRFFEATRDISTNNIEAFFSNKDSFPGIPDDVQKLVLAQDWETVKSKYLDKEILDFAGLLDFIDNLFNKEVVHKGLFKRSGLNIISFIFKISEDETFSDLLQVVYYSNSKSLSKIRSKINSKEIGLLILNLNPTLILKFAKRNLDKNDRLLDEVVQQINTGNVEDKNHHSLLLEFVRSFAEEEEYLEKIGERFSKNLRENPDLFKQFEEILKSTTAVKSLIKEDLLDEFVSELEADPAGAQTRVEIINRYNETRSLSVVLSEKYSEKILSFLASNSLPVISFWTEQLELFVEQIESEEIKDSIFTTLKQKNDYLWPLYNAHWNQEQYKNAVTNFLKTATSFYKSTKGAKSEIATWLNNYFANNEDPDLVLEINELYRDVINHFQPFEWVFADNVIAKFKQLTEWADKKEVAITLNLMLSKTTDEKGLSESQIQICLNNYIDQLETNETDIKSWFSGVIKNKVIKTQLAEVISGLNIDRKLGLLDVIRELDKELLQQSVQEIIFEAETGNLEDTFAKLDRSSAGAALVNTAIEKKVKDLQKEDEPEYFEQFLKFIVDRKLTQAILVVIISKISPFLHDEISKQEKIFALDILSKIDVPKDKIGLVKELLRDLDHSDFDEDEKELLDRVKKAIK